MMRPGEKRGHSSARRTSSSGPALLSIGLALSAGGCSVLLDFDEPIGPGSSDAGADADAGIADAADMPDASAAADAETAVANCIAFEPNDSLAAPAAITPMTLAASICPGTTDVDFYSFVLAASNNLTISLAFDSPTSNLDLEVYNSMDELVAATEGDTSIEQIVLSQAQGNDLPEGTYRIKILSETPEDSVDYDLTLDVSSFQSSQAKGKGPRRPALATGKGFDEF
ncbi:MAG: hypothetical protein GY811_20275 [Myxococcales bacterium]|nr:hypothetical protein [Myxococcales bacterium]